MLATIRGIFAWVELDFHFTTPGKLVKQAYPAVASGVLR